MDYLYSVYNIWICLETRPFTVLIFRIEMKCGWRHQRAGEACKSLKSVQSKCNKNYVFELESHFQLSCATFGVLSLYFAASPFSFFCRCSFHIPYFTYQVAWDEVSGGKQGVFVFNGSHFYRNCISVMQMHRKQEPSTAHRILCKRFSRKQWHRAVPSSKK